MAGVSKVLEVPVVLIVFNRTTYLKQIIRNVAKSTPREIFVVADGPRENSSDDKRMCLEVLDMIVREVDWECQIKWNVSNVNLGCKERVISGLSWVFDACESAIILEDDCVPEPSFLFFCQELLTAYEHSSDVGLISGNNFHNKNFNPSYDFYFSNYPHIWGWATWRRTWRLYDSKLQGWNGTFATSHLKVSPNFTYGEKRKWEALFDSCKNGEVDTWDYQLVYSVWNHGLKSINPSQNLVSNLGFGAAASHTMRKNIFAQVPVHAVKFPLRHPASRDVNQSLDRRTGFINFSPSLLAKFLRRYARWLIAS